MRSIDNDEGLSRGCEDASRQRLGAGDQKWGTIATEVYVTGASNKRNNPCSNSAFRIMGGLEGRLGVYHALNSEQYLRDTEPRCVRTAGNCTTCRQG